MIRHVLLALVLASVFALLSVESVAAQSRAVQPPAVQSPTIELSGWETATLLRLQDLVDAELARRRASGDVAALRRQLGPTWAQRRQWPTQPSFGDAPRKRFHGSHLGRDRAGRGRPPGAGRVLRRTLRRDDSRHLPRVETPRRSSRWHHHLGRSSRHRLLKRATDALNRSVPKNNGVHQNRLVVTNAVNLLAVRGTIAKERIRAWSIPDNRDPRGRPVRSTRARKTKGSAAICWYTG